MELEKWQKLNIFEQLGNIGSEVSRARYFEDKGEIKKRNSSLERSFDLLDLTLADRKNVGHSGEIGRLKEVLADIYSAAGNYSVALPDLEKMFFEYATVARK
ncbi:MAG: hypothetical protein WC768_01210 [Patescibacteria group bacterium]|jgi:hypothetical protein